MKKISWSLIVPFILLTFTGCTGIKPANFILEKYPQQVTLSPDSDSLKIYFPSFTDSSWSEDNRYVMRGDGTVIVFPNGEVMVVDGFVEAAASQFIDFINSLGINHIDYLVLTHFHGDHSGTFPELIKAFNVDTIYTNGAYTNSSPTKKLQKCISENGVTEIIIKEGDVFFIDPCTITVFSPNLSEEDLYNAYHNPGETARLVNNTSLVFKLEYDSFSALFTGDVNKNEDRKIANKYGDALQSTIMKIPHHGDLYTASSNVFVRSVKPAYGIVMDNRFVSDMGSIISGKYNLYGTHLLFRDDNGYILVESDGVDYSCSEVSF